MGPSEAVWTWLYRVTHNVVRNHRRKERLAWGFLKTSWILHQDPSRRSSVAAAVLHLYQAFERLREADRELLILHEIEGLSAAELASHLGLDRNQLYVRLHRARARFKAVWKQQQA